MSDREPRGVVEGGWRTEFYERFSRAELVRDSLACVGPRENHPMAARIEFSRGVQDLVGAEYRRQQLAVPLSTKDAI